MIETSIHYKFLSKRIQLT